ncbi:MAG TPA: hypothetical protein VK699_14475 [Terriglobales bacterium]|jgi:hypothetical protein|nr:hypothetical protein [Terriglobales bacterium]
MPDNSLTNTDPQFGTAEYERKTGEDYCRLCNQSIVGSYYRVNGSMACPGCADMVQRQGPQDSHAAFIRGLLLGIGASIVGLVLYAAFAIVTGWMIGYVSLAVGYIVGKAIMVGSKGVGGRRYQIAAVVLTYAAVSLAAIPIWISIISKQKEDHQQIEMKQQSTSDKQLSQQDQPAAQPPPRRCATDAANTKKCGAPKDRSGGGASADDGCWIGFSFSGIAKPHTRFAGSYYPVRRNPHRVEDSRRQTHRGRWSI